VKLNSSNESICEICENGFQKDQQVYEFISRVVLADRQEYNYNIQAHTPSLETASGLAPRDSVMLAHLSCFEKIGSSLENAKQAATNLTDKDCQKLYEYIHWILKHKL
jgi:hypothetical protein